MKKWLLPLLAALALPGAPQDLDQRAMGELKICQSNLKNIGTALEMYSTDHGGRYPANLKALTPDYLKTIPTCMAAGADTYSATYKMRAKPDKYSFACQGHHHQTAFQKADHPAYNSDVGLITDPLPAALQAKIDAAIAADPRASLRQCTSNLKNLATALEMWSCDHQGRYPKSMSEVAPKYLRTMPTCPAARRDTYSASYQMHAKPDVYTFCCQGANHSGLPANRPAYNAIQGLTDR